MKSCLGLFLAYLICLNLQATPISAEDTVRETTISVLERLNSERTRLEDNPMYIKEIVKEIIIPQFDFDKMAELVMEDYWNLLDSNKKTCFTHAFKNLLVERYAYVLLSYDNHTISYEPAKPIGELGYVSVRQIITREGALPLPVDYPMHKTESGWRVVDLVIDGISLVKSYKNMFSIDAKIRGLDNFLETLPTCQYTDHE